MKAWRVSVKDECCATVVFAETRGKAKSMALATDCCEYAKFCDIEIRREKELDKYYRCGKIEMDWENPADRIALVKECGFCCDPDYFDWEDCSACSAKEYCDYYHDRLEESAGTRESVTFEHRGYFVQQSSYNNGIMIVKDDRMVYHAQCTDKLTERQLRQLVDGGNEDG